MLTLIGWPPGTRSLVSVDGHAAADVSRPISSGAGAARAGQHRGELFAAIARGQVAGAAHVLADHVADAGQEAVAGLVTEAVVQRLEAVEVDHQQAQRRGVAQCAVPLLVQRGVELAPVGQAGQGVGAGQGLQLGVGLVQAFLEAWRRWSASRRVTR
jgi:hypothetical protein